MQNCPKRHKLEKIKELADLIKLGHVDFRIHYNCGSMVIEILDFCIKKGIELDKVK